MTKSIISIFKVLYWSIFWAIGLGWVVLVQGDGDILSRLYKERIFISIIVFAGAVGSIFVDELLLYKHETTYRGQSKLHSSSSGFWAIIWTTMFIIATIFSPRSCSNYSCWDLGVLGTVILLIFGTPIVCLYTAFIGTLGTIVYVSIFGVGGDLKR